MYIYIYISATEIALTVGIMCWTTRLSSGINIAMAE